MNSERSFTISIDRVSTIIGIEPGSTFTICIGRGKAYSTSIEKLHATLVRWHQNERPTGKRRRRVPGDKRGERQEVERQTARA